jgi:hypothetical protein
MTVDAAVVDALHLWRGHGKFNTLGMDIVYIQKEKEHFVFGQFQSVLASCS